MIQHRKQFCRQCDTRVSLAEAGRCRSTFCKVKHGWPVTSGRYVSPETLAVLSNAPLPICEMIFAAAEGDQKMVASIRGYSTTIPLRRVRQAVIWKAKLSGFSFHKIARAMNRDHSSVMHAYRIAETLVATNAAFRATCDRITP